MSNAEPSRWSGGSRVGSAGKCVYNPLDDSPARTSPIPAPGPRRRGGAATDTRITTIVHLHPSSPDKLVITGIDGVVSANLWLWLSNRCQVVNACRLSPSPSSVRGIMLRDLGSSQEIDSLDRLASQEKPRWIIHCGSFAAAAWDPSAATVDGNADAAECAALARAADRVGAHLTVLSTDAIFTGPRIFHAEDAPANSHTPTAGAARRVEEALAGSGALVVRTHAYGWSPAGTTASFAEKAWHDLREGRPRSFPSNRHATPILATDLADLIWMACQRSLRGVYHFAGAERVSPHRFAREMATAFGLGDLVLPLEDHCTAEGTTERPEETSLATRRAQQALGHPMPTLREGLHRFAAQARSGHRARMQWEQRSHRRSAA